MKRRPMIGICIVLGLIAAGSGLSAANGAPAPRSRWIAAWGATLAGGQTAAPRNATVRNVARVTLRGSGLRIRLTNPDPKLSLVVGAATVGLEQPNTPGAVVPGTTRTIRYHGASGFTIPPSTDAAYSDPVPLTIRPLENVVVSLFLPTSTEPSAYAATWNSLYKTADGAGDRTRSDKATDFTAQQAAPDVGGQHPPLTCTGCNTYALTAVDVYTSVANGAVVGLGSSTFHGYNTDPNKWDTVLYDLAGRINHEVPAGQQKGIVNEGIGGDTLHAGMTRVGRDVLSQTGVTGVIVYDLNDIGGGRTADEIEQDYRSLVAEAHRAGVRVFCPTWPPESLMLRAVPTHEREKLNAWLLNSGTCDDVVDWGTVVSDPELHVTYMAEYQSDTIHPNTAGHRAMANATPMRWFELPPLGAK